MPVALNETQITFLRRYLGLNLNAGGESVAAEGADQPDFQGAEAQQDGNAADEMAAVRKRLADLSSALRAFQANFPADWPELLQLVAGVKPHIDAGSVADAKAAIDAVETVLDDVKPREEDDEDDQIADAPVQDQAQDPQADPLEEDEDLPLEAMDARSIAAKARIVWQDAVRVWRTQVDGLETAIKGDQSPEAVLLSKFGLGQWGIGIATGIDQSLSQLEGVRAGNPGHKIRVQVAGQIAQFKKQIESDPAAAAMDNNPWNVKVELASGLGGALQKIENLVRNS